MTHTARRRKVGTGAARIEGVVFERLGELEGPEDPEPRARSTSWAEALGEWELKKLK